MPDYAEKGDAHALSRGPKNRSTFFFYAQASRMKIARKRNATRTAQAKKTASRAPPARSEEAQDTAVESAVAAAGPAPKPRPADYLKTYLYSVQRNAPVAIIPRLPAKQQ